MLALRAEDGQVLWKEENGGEFSAAPAADERGVYLATEVAAASDAAGRARTSGALRALSHKSGVTLWMRTLAAPLRGRLASGDGLLYGGDAVGRILAFRKEGGGSVWAKQLKSPATSQIELNGEKLFVGSEDGTIYALEKKTGRELWRYRTRGPLRGFVAVDARHVYFGSPDGHVYALRVGDGRLAWRSRTGAEVQAVANTPQGPLAASLDNFVYLLSQGRGARIWKRQVSGRVLSRPLVTENGALIAPLSGEVCLVLDLASGKPINFIPVGEDNSVAASPVLSEDMLLIPTQQGLLSFTASNAVPK